MEDTKQHHFGLQKQVSIRHLTWLYVADKFLAVRDHVNFFKRYFEAYGTFR